jgi:MFS transporter, SP family, arabinose:H+ symporter
VEYGPTEWRWKLGVAALPALIFYLSLLFIPESPRWLVRKGHSAQALRILKDNGEPDPAQELADIAASLVHTQGSAEENVFQWRYRLPIFLAISIGMFNQLSGINAILYYLNSIFLSAGFDRVSSDLQAVVIGLTNLAAVSIALAVIDRLGRRRMLLIGSVGTAICMFGVAIIFKLHRWQEALVWLLVGFIAFFSFSQGAVIWVYISEVFPNRVRAKGQSIGSFTHWFMNAIVSFSFQ